MKKFIKWYFDWSSKVKDLSCWISIGGIVLIIMGMKLGGWGLLLNFPGWWLILGGLAYENYKGSITK